MCVHMYVRVSMLLLLMNCTRYLLGLAAIFDILKGMVGG